MAEVYRLSTSGSAGSQRFKHYVGLIGDGLPLTGYNPMTSKPVLETIETLLAIDAEKLADEHADGNTLHITVATPGMWTDRISTEIDHRLAEVASDSILLWTGEEVSVDVVRRETIAQVVRLRSSARTTEEVAMREGLAYASSGAEGEWDDAVAEALKVVGADEALATKAALLYGDDVAKTMGFVPLGLRDHAGYRHCIAMASARNPSTSTDRSRRS